MTYTEEDYLDEKSRGTLQKGRLTKKGKWTGVYEQSPSELIIDIPFEVWLKKKAKKARKEAE